MHFTKMQGLGNDYLYVYGEVPDHIEELSRNLSNRHFGAGSDGLIFISPSSVADFKMRIFNADGSEAMMCGNGIRCVGKYVYDKGFTDKTRVTVETLSGIKTLDLRVVGGKVRFVSVDMGFSKVFQDLSLNLDGESVTCTPLSVGNPHAVIFVDDSKTAPVGQIGPLIEHHPSFPGGVNVEFVQILSPNHVSMRVWERGSGITMACGTGACAAVSASISKGYCTYNTAVTVSLEGGDLEITVYPNQRMSMTGPAEMIYEGETVSC